MFSSVQTITQTRTHKRTHTHINTHAHTHIRTPRLSTHLDGPCPLKIGGKDSRLSLLISGVDEPSNGRQNSRSVCVPSYGLNHSGPHLSLPATYYHAPEP